MYQFVKLLISIGEIIWGFVRVGNSAHLKTRGSEKPQNLCMVRSSQKMNQNEKNERILYLKLIPIVFMIESLFPTGLQCSIFLYLLPSTRSSQHCFQQSTGRVHQFVLEIRKLLSSIKHRSRTKLHVTTCNFLADASPSE